MEKAILKSTGIKLDVIRESGLHVADNGDTSKEYRVKKVTAPMIASFRVSENQIIFI